MKTIDTSSIYAIDGQFKNLRFGWNPRLIDSDSRADAIKDKATDDEKRKINKEINDLGLSIEVAVWYQDKDYEKTGEISRRFQRTGEYTERDVVFLNTTYQKNQKRKEKCAERLLNLSKKIWEIDQRD